MGKTRNKADLAHKDRFISKMFLQGDSVILTIRLRPEMEGNGADHNATGPEDISRMTLGSATIGQLDGWQGDTHPSRHDSTLLPDPQIHRTLRCLPKRRGGRHTQRRR